LVHQVEVAVVDAVDPLVGRIAEALRLVPMTA
jgi:hypothetical protein